MIQMKKIMICAAFIAAMGIFTATNAQEPKKCTKTEQCCQKKCDKDKKCDKACCKDNCKNAECKKSDCKKCACSKQECKSECKKSCDSKKK